MGDFFPPGYDEYGNPPVCVSQAELNQQVAVCLTALGLGGRGFFGLITSGTCTSCVSAPTPATCGACAATAGLSSVALAVASQACRPPPVIGCP